MPNPLDLLDKYIFSGVPSNAVYDLLKAGWQKVNERAWEDLYLDAFEAALQDERPRLARYADGEITLGREELHRTLHYELATSIASMPLSELTSQDFAVFLAKALVQQQALVIGGHALSETDYAQLVLRLVQHATARFKAAVTEKAFQQVMVDQALHDHALLAQTQTYLQQQFDLVLGALSLLPDIKDDTDAIRRFLETNAPTPHAAIPTRVPDPRARHLVGRADDVTRVCNYLIPADDSDAGVVAVVAVRGMGGIGKTEVAIAAVAALRAHFAEVIWLEGGANDVFAMQERLARALGVRLDADALLARGDALHLALRDGPRRLVVLDDLRRSHLADFLHLKPPCPPCALLITSRRTDLPLPPEAIVPLGQLSPDKAHDLLTALLPAGWSARELDAARSIALLLDCIPLPLTLAARRARQIAQRRDASATLPLAALLAELKARRLQVLNQGEDPTRADLSVVITFDASYHDLVPEDQVRLRGLGVFARNEFELPALQAVWNTDANAARQTAQRLVATGLLEEIAPDTWWMHDLLREYAEERLHRAGDAELTAARLAHARHWQHLLDEREVLSAADWQWLERQRAEVERAAVWLLGNWQTAPQDAAWLAVAIAQAYQPYTWSQWEAWLLAGQAAAMAEADRAAARRLQRGLAAYCQHRGDTVAAQGLLEASLISARTLLAESTTPNAQAAAQRGVAVTLGD
ncbi:MAG: NB-ARC domain-containing protein, partial [Anaerolineae bacterium]